MPLQPTAWFSPASAITHRGVATRPESSAPARTRPLGRCMNRGAISNLLNPPLCTPL